MVDFNWSANDYWGGGVIVQWNDQRHSSATFLIRSCQSIVFSSVLISLCFIRLVVVIRPQYPHCTTLEIRISVLKITEKGVLNPKICMSEIFRKGGSFLTKYSRKNRKRGILGPLGVDFRSRGRIGASKHYFMFEGDKKCVGGKVPQ